MMMMASTTTTRSSPTGFGVIHHLNPPLPVPVVKDNNSNKTDKETTCKSSAKPSSRGHPQVKQKPSRLVTTSLITITSSSTTAEVSSSLPSSSSSSSSVSVSSPGDGPSVITTSSPMSQSPSSPPSSFTSILSSAPIPSPGSTPLRILLDHWAEYVEQSTGRRFYHNYLTKESSWKPPRRTTSSLVSVCYFTRISCNSIVKFFFHHHDNRSPGFTDKKLFARVCLGNFVVCVMSVSCLAEEGGTETGVLFHRRRSRRREEEDEEKKQRRPRDEGGKENE